MSTLTATRPETLDDALGCGDDGLPRYYSLKDAVKFVPPIREGKRTHVATMTRWGLEGVAARSTSRKGQRIKLRMTRFPGGWATTKEWVAESLAELTADRTGDDSSVASVIPTASARHREADTNRQLDAFGV